MSRRRPLFRGRRPTYGVVGFGAADMQATTSERYSVYNHKYHQFYKKSELALMPDYQEQYISNPLATLLIDYVVARLGEFKLAGDPEQVKKANKIFREIDFKHNFYETMKQMVMNGTGIMVKNDVKGRFRRTSTRQWQITRDDKTGEIKYTLSEGKKQTFDWPAADVRHNDLAVFKVFELPDRPEGISLVRPALPALAALEELVFKDIPAGVHNFLTVERIMKLPLDGYNTKAEQTTFFENMRNRWANRDPSGVGITIIDDKVDVYYMGTEEGTGAGSRVLPILEFIEPILATVMLQFLMPIGLILQSGANKSIIKRQQMEANLRLEIMRRRVEEQQYAQNWPDMGLDPEKVWIVWPKTEAELMDEWVIDREMFERRIISKEYVVTKYGIQDDGTTFYEGVPTMGGSDEGDDKEETDSQAENHQSVKDD